MEPPRFLKRRASIARPVARFRAGLLSAGEAVMGTLVKRAPWVLDIVEPWLEAERADRARAEAALADLEAELARYRARREADEAVRADAERKVAALGTELDEARARASSAERDWSRDRAELAQRTAELEAELSSLAPHLDDARRRIEELEAALREARAGRPPEEGPDPNDVVPRSEVEALRRKERDLLVKANMMDRRIRELSRYADENAALRQRLVDFEASVARGDALTRRVKELEARAFAAESTTESAAPPRDVTAGPDDTMGTSLDQQLAAALQERHGRVAVVADSHGLLMAAAGERAHQDNLAAVAGSLIQTAQRAQDFLPLGTPVRLELQYAEGMEIATRVFRCEDEPMALTMLRRHEVERDAAVESTISTIVQLLGTG